MLGTLPRSRSVADADHKRLLQLEQRGYIVALGTFKYKPNPGYLKGDRGQPKWELRFGTGQIKYVDHIEAFGRIKTLASVVKADGCRSPGEPVLLVLVKGAVAFK